MTWTLAFYLLCSIAFWAFFWSELESLKSDLRRREPARILVGRGFVATVALAIATVASIVMFA